MLSKNFTPRPNIDPATRFRCPEGTYLVSQIDDQLGEKLFERGCQFIALTDDGASSLFGEASEEEVIQLISRNHYAENIQALAKLHPKSRKVKSAVRERLAKL